MSQKEVVTVKVPSQRRQEFDELAESHEQFETRSDVARACLKRGWHDIQQDMTAYPGSELIQEGTKLASLTAILAAILSVGGAISAEAVALSGSAMLVFLIAHLTGQWLAATGKL